MTKKRTSAVVAGLLVTSLLWVAALSNGLGSNGAAAAAAHATRPTPAASTAHPAAAAPQEPSSNGESQPKVPTPGSSVSGPGTSYPAGSTGSGVGHGTETVVGFGDGAAGDD